MKKVINRGKQSKTLNEVKPVENISKNLQRFLAINCVQISLSNIKYQIPVKEYATSATLIAFRLKKRFKYRTTVTVLIHIKHVKNRNHLGIVQNNERTCKNIPANIKTYSS